MTTRIAVRAYAKLNLWLRVLAREADGYHSIETLFHRVELHDDVVVALAPEGERAITCSEDVGPDRDNLAFRAAELYCDAMGWRAGFRIGITKRIPVQGGLGGGSADAAATLLALNAMSPRACDTTELCALGLRLGADVPFLITDAPMALAWGHGERMLELAALPRKHVALAIPPFGISTAEAYGAMPQRRAAAGRRRLDELGDWRAIARDAGNDLTESPAVAAHREIAGAREAFMEAGALMAGMTGSGSVVFGIFESEPDRAGLERGTKCRVVLTQTVLNVEGPAPLD